RACARRPEREPRSACAALLAGPADPTGSEFIQRYFERLSKAFYKALDNAHSKGELRDAVALREEADFFTASTLGMFVMIRANAPSAIIENAAQIAVKHLEELQG
ncbi:MAG: hypothetical protein AAF485_06835, partial [Chloroflexota bacterium]